MRQGLEPLCNRGARRFRAIYEGRSARGHHCLSSVRCGAGSFTHAWANKFHNNIPPLQWGVEITFSAEIREYTRLDGSRDFGLTHIEDVQVVSS